ncbi:MAG: hypothetical protein PHQ23_17625 [Candidatus Wallbacteria bacterium]|nr:hypothetical protein [Candidatus Wallbacteria bacterium]
MKSENKNPNPAGKEKFLWGNLAKTPKEQTQNDQQDYVPKDPISQGERFFEGGNCQIDMPGLENGEKVHEHE